MIRRLGLAAALVTAAQPALAQSVVVIRGNGDNVGAAIIGQALAGPHDLVERGTTRRLIKRDSSVSHTLVSIGRTVVVEGTVHGDLIAIGADVYMHPGGRVDGRLIAVGGGAYESMLAHTGDVVVFHDFTYDIATTPAGYQLTYRAITVDAAPAFPVPSLYGIRIPAYDRIDGLSLPIAPAFAVAGTRFTVTPRLTYRSNLGKLDPGMAAALSLGATRVLAASVERTTVTNDAWIWSDFINSFEYLLFGHDSRNYYRATRGALTLSDTIITLRGSVTPFVSGRWERAHSVVRDSAATGAPWTFTGRHSLEHALRPNPPIDDGGIISAVAGIRATWTDGHVLASGLASGELGSALGDVSAPIGCVGSTCLPSAFGQLTLDGRVTFPTFGTQSFGFEAHAVATRADRTPRQRWAYVGGSGSIPTLDILERGGDQLFYVDFRYSIPLTRPVLPIVGAPTIGLREVIGGADVGRFPSLAQAIGVRISAGVVYVESLMDPVTHHASHSLGLSLVR